MLTSADVHVATRRRRARRRDRRARPARGRARGPRRTPGLGLPRPRAGRRRPPPSCAWPDDWAALIEASPLVAAGVVRWEHGLLYLDRYHRLETPGARRPRRPARAGAAGGRRGRGWTPALAKVRGGHFSAEQEAAVVAARPPAYDDPHRRSRHRQDHHRRPAAGAARRPGRGRRPARDRAGRTDRQGGDPAAGGRGLRARRRGRRPGPRRPTWSAGSTGSTLHRLLGWRPTTRPASGTTGATGSSTTWSSSTSRRWSS